MTWEPQVEPRPDDRQEILVFELKQFSGDFTNRSNSFVPSNQFRARKYLKMARIEYNNAVDAGLKRMLAQDDDEDLQQNPKFKPTLNATERFEAQRRDVFLLVWLASQHINTMVSFGAGMAGILAEACDMSLGLHQMAGDVSIHIDAATQYCLRWVSCSTAV